MGLRATLPNHIPACRSEFLKEGGFRILHFSEFKCQKYGLDLYDKKVRYWQNLIKILLINALTLSGPGLERFISCGWMRKTLIVHPQHYIVLVKV